MLVHAVFFWLKKNAPKSALPNLIRDAKKYLQTSTARHVWAGPPAKTPLRDVVNATYDMGLLVTFDSVKDHDAYQEAPSHQTFIKRNKKHWQRVEVYDFQ